MNTKTNDFLVPVYKKPHRLGKGTLDYSNLKDITFDKFFKFFTQKLHEYSNKWNWLHARVDAVQAYTQSSLLEFCHDSEKIRVTQNMISIFMKEDELREFILDKNAPFDIWSQRGEDQDPYVGMLRAFNEITSELIQKFEKIKDGSRETLSPFISYLAKVKSGSLMKDINNFLPLFNEVIEFTFLIANHKEFDDFDSRLKEHDYQTQHPHKHFDDKLRYGIMGAHDIKCYLVEGVERKLLENKYLFGEEVESHCLMSIPKIFIAKQVFGLERREFLTEFMPSSHEPLEMTLRIEKLAHNKHRLSYTLREPTTDVVLEYIPETLKENGPGWNRKKMLPRIREDGDFPKGKRTSLQKSLLGVTKTVVTKGRFVYRAKCRYFQSFFSKCERFISEDFGFKLGELRYLAYISNEFRYISISHSLIFPEILPIEDGVAEIKDASNPTLLLNPKHSKNVVSNDINFDNKRRIQMITGPNQNGKSRYMDTIGLSQIMFQAGWPIFAKNARISPKTDLRIHYVHSGIGITGESRFSNECLGILGHLNSVKGKYPLFLIDEPYTGTNYIDAELLLKEFLRACSEENISVVLASHFHGLIEYIDTLPNGVNLHCVLGVENSFTFKIAVGSSTKSNALHVAKKAGVRYSNIKKILQSYKIDKEEIMLISEENEEEHEGDLPF